MDLPSNPPVSPAVRITVLLRLASEGFQDAFGARPEWLAAVQFPLGGLRKQEVREATCMPGTLARALMISSLMPSQKNS